LVSRVARVLGHAEIRDKLQSMGVDAIGSRPDEFRRVHAQGDF
jgi:hypothetical protein